MQIDQCYDGSPLRISRYLICSSVRVLLSRFLDLGISLLALDFDQAALPPWPTRQGITFRKHARYSGSTSMAYIHGMGKKIWCVVRLVTGEHDWLSLWYPSVCIQYHGVGNILHYRVYDKHFVILNSLEDSVELLEKRSGIYSDRPYMPMLELYVALSSMFVSSHYLNIAWISEWDGSATGLDSCPMVQNGDPTNACTNNSSMLGLLQGFILRKQGKLATFCTEFWQLQMTLLTITEREL